MKTNTLTVIHPFIPKEHVDFVDELMQDADDLELRISKPRLSKWGSYVREGNRHEISVNSNLNPYQFLLTLLHEYSHYVVYKKYGDSVKPHGPEWKSEFNKILTKLLEYDKLPKELYELLERHAQKPKASITADLKLKKLLDTYSKSVTEQGYTPLEELADGEKFFFHGRVFQKVQKRRKLYKCLDVERNKYYLFQPTVLVKKYSE